MTYQILFTPRAKKELSKLPTDVRVRIIKALETLTENPISPGVTKLSLKEENLYRIRVGDYRVIFSIENNKLIILVVKVGHRREVYRRL